VERDPAWLGNCMTAATAAAGLLAYLFPYMRSFFLFLTVVFILIAILSYVKAGETRRRSPKKTSPKPSEQQGSSLPLPQQSVHLRVEPIRDGDTEYLNVYNSGDPIRVHGIISTLTGVDGLPPGGGFATWEGTTERSIVIRRGRSWKLVAGRCETHEKHKANYRWVFPYYAEGPNIAERTNAVSVWMPASALHVDLPLSPRGFPVGVRVSVITESALPESFETDLYFLGEIVRSIPMV
jgi:hypothetical protein